MAPSPGNHSASAPSPGPRGWRKPACAAAFAAYLLLVSWDSLKAHFAPDEMLAIWTFWHPSPLRLLESQFMLWRGYFRPMGGLFFVPPYLAFGLNPVPFHALLLLLLMMGAYQMYRVARALGAGGLPSAMVALIACYHGGLSNLYYNSVFVFDVLCGIFYFAAFAYYARIRSSGRLLSGGQTAAFLGLYLCALNSKEMAVTMPVILLAYEWQYHAPPGWPWKEFMRWLKGPGRVIIFAGLLNLVSMYGKWFGQYGLMKDPSYHPVFSPNRFVDFQERYIGDIFYHLLRCPWFITLAIWIAVTYLAWRRKRPLLRFCWFWIVVTPLPIVFLEGRDQACLYVTLAGWAVLAGTLFADWLPSATRVVAAEPLFRHWQPGRVRTLVAASGFIALAAWSWYFKATEIAPAIPSLGRETFDVLAQFRAVNPRVKPGAKVIFVEDPIAGGFDTAFIAELWFGDRKTSVRLNQKTPLGPEEFAGADAIFTWREGKLVRLR